MSRVGKLPIQIPNNLKLSIDNNQITFDSGKDKKTYKISYGIKPEIKDGQLRLYAENKSDPDISMKIGMDRSNINNIVSGIRSPYKITLEINGVGYKVVIDKKLLVLTLGYSHEIFYIVPEGINVATEKPNLLIISGEDKILVGLVASEIMDFRPPEPYKGKGVKVFGKKILRKQGKKK